MAISSGIAIKWKELAMGGHIPSVVAGYAGFKIALFVSGASLSNGTSVYKTDGEVTAGAATNYVAGGNICTVLSVSVAGSVAYIQFANQSWTSATFGADGCLIYNVSTSTAKLRNSSATYLSLTNKSLGLTRLSLGIIKSR